MKYFVCAAPGHYGTRTEITAVYDSFRAALADRKTEATAVYEAESAEAGEVIWSDAAKRLRRLDRLRRNLPALTVEQSKRTPGHGLYWVVGHHTPLGPFDTKKLADVAKKQWEREWLAQPATATA